MSKWTLRHQRTRQMLTGEQQTHSAALRAQRYVRRHAWQTGPQEPLTNPVTEVDPFKLVADRMLEEARKLVPVSVPSIVRYVRDNLSCTDPEDEDPKCVDCGFSRLLDCECD